MKDNLTSALVLTLPERIKGFVVYCDASRVGLGCFLMLQSNMIAYASMQLNVHEMNYPTNDLQLVAVVFPLKFCRDYIYWVHLDMLTDNNSIKYVFTKKNLNLRKRTWLDIL